MASAIGLGEALAWLDGLLPAKAPAVAEALRPAVSDRDLELLQRALAPAELSVELTDLLTWHDGMIRSEWWPVMSCGPLVSATEAVDLCEQRRDDDGPHWRFTWCPIAAEGWYLAVVENAPAGNGLVIEASSPDPPDRLAPSLAAMMHATCEVLAAGLPADMDVDGDPVLHHARTAIIDEVYAAYTWPEIAGL